MNVLIIYAHPNPKSFNHAILEEVERGLRDGGHSFTTLDLYEDGFNPVLVFGEKKRRSDLASDPETERYRQLVKATDHLILWY